MGVTFTPADGLIDEAAIREWYARAGLSPRTWSNGAGDAYAAHRHDYHKTLFCLRGSITFEGGDGERWELRPGDRLDIAPGTTHAAVVGLEGVTCIEAAGQG
jgi:mannose-6-phosphate isomerase-like protein (cupin superfamily)